MQQQHRGLLWISDINFEGEENEGKVENVEKIETVVPFDANSILKQLEQAIVPFYLFVRQGSGHHNDKEDDKDDNQEKEDDDDDGYNNNIKVIAINEYLSNPKSFTLPTSQEIIMGIQTERFLIVYFLREMMSIQDIPLIAFMTSQQMVRLRLNVDVCLLVELEFYLIDHHPRWWEICQHLCEANQVRKIADLELNCPNWESLPRHLFSGISIDKNNDNESHLEDNFKGVWMMGEKFFAVTTSKGIFKIIEPAFSELFLKYHTTTIGSRGTASQTPTSAALLSTTSERKRSYYSQPVLEARAATLSLPSPVNNAPSQPIPYETIDFKSQNKNILKKLILLSLRHVGVDRHHGEFESIWKHLYCACVFALRRELSTEKVEQSVLLNVIRSNMNFLNIK